MPSSVTIGTVSLCLLAVYLYIPAPELSGRLLNWKNTGESYQYRKNLNIFYKDEGTKTSSALLVLHGYPTSSFDWHKILTGLKDIHKRVILPDFLGFGFSDKPTFHSYSIGEQADIIEKLLQHLDIKEVHILAHDYGDTVAQELLFRFEERKKTGRIHIEINSICMLNGGIFPETNFPSLIQKVGAVPVLGHAVSRLIFYKVFKLGFARIFGPNTQPKEEELLEFWTLMVYKGGHRNNHEILQYSKERRQHRERWVNPLMSTTVPVHVIYGPEDVINPKGFIEYFRKMVPNGSIDVLNGIGHYPQLEAPDAVLKSILKFNKTLQDL